jgi:putative lipoic acid-binding regulatory protein
MTPQLPSLELIESQHSFPGPYIFKVIGDHREDFVADALSLALNSLGDDRDFQHSTRPSKSGQHLALTLSLTLNSAAEVHGVYENLLKLNGLRALF